MPKKASKQSENGTTALIEVPLVGPLQGSFGMHIDMRLKSDMASVLRRIARAYDLQQARLKCGRRVVDSTTALRKILEEIEEGITA